jgi:Ca2+-binding RTX toxin-like protein
VYRLVGAGDAFREFNYDQTSPSEDRGDERIVVRAMEQLDYTLGGADYEDDHPDATYVDGAADLDGAGPVPADNGAPDLIHGESGDDHIFGMTGSDVMFGESDDDDIVGGYGNDWISGGTGQDGVLGDDGLLYTSRNSTAGEPLYGIAGLLASDASTKYSNGNALNEEISTPGTIQYAVINVEGELKKTADLVPFSFDPDWLALDDEFPDDASNTPFADDVVFGGLDSDFLHGGSGDDAISGAEALEQAYVPTFGLDGEPNGVLDLGYNAFALTPPVDPGDAVANPNPGDVLAFNPLDLDGQHLNNRFRAGEFFLYDEYDPRRKILLGGDGELLWKSQEQGTAYEFLLNFDQTEGVFRSGGTVPKATGQQTETYGEVNDDGRDAIFGDLGNDWIVGGTGRDNTYGGWGNDLLNADDDHGTNGDLNDEPDTHPTYEDRAYGGAGRDVLIANTGGDRLIDWVGEYNSYLVPFAPFGQATVSRTLQPFLPEFLYALSAGDGADPTRYVDAIGGQPPAPTNNDPNPSRNGEPHGELGLVLQKDFAWQDQTGAPADPQAGNIPGGHRDVLRSADFNDGQTQGFVTASGTWTIQSGQLRAAPSSGDSVSLYYLDEYIPSYYEVLATVNTSKPTATVKGNAYIVFDYYSADDFKFAGIDVSTNKLQIGHRTSAGWAVDVSINVQLRGDTNYNLKLAVNGTAVTLILDNSKIVNHVFAPRVVSEEQVGLNTGMIGVGAEKASTRYDNVTVQKLAPVTTFEGTNEFDGSFSPVMLQALSGSWAQASGRYAATAANATPALSITPLQVSAASFLGLNAKLSSQGTGGVVFDLYAADDFKFAAIVPAADQVLIGHYAPRSGWIVDATASLALADAADHRLEVTLVGTTVSVIVNGKTVAGLAFNGLVTDGAFGLLGRNGASSFDWFTVKTDDPAYASAGALMAATAGSGTGAELDAAGIDSLAGEAVQRWIDTGLADERDRLMLSATRIEVADLPERMLGFTAGRTVFVDSDAAGYGWFIDPTPRTNEEFGATAMAGVLKANPDSAAFGAVDLLTVLGHELGHLIGLQHASGEQDDLAVMRETLVAGERMSPFDTPAPAHNASPATTPAQPGSTYYFDRESASMHRLPQAAANEAPVLYYFERNSASLTPVANAEDRAPSWSDTGDSAKTKKSGKVAIDWNRGLKGLLKTAALDALPKLESGSTPSIRLR